MKKLLRLMKDFAIDLLKNGWFKIFVFILICCVLFIVYDLSEIHLQEVRKLEAQLKAGEISYEHAEFFRAALHEQIVYQLVLAIIVAMVMVVGMLMEQNSKLRERVRRVDYRLWKLDRNVEEIYELQRLRYENELDSYERDEYEAIDLNGEDDNTEVRLELERLHAEHLRLMKEVKELEVKHKARKNDNKPE